MTLLSAKKELRVGRQALDDCPDILESNQEVVHDFGAEGSAYDPGEVGSNYGFCHQALLGHFTCLCEAL